MANHLMHEPAFVSGVSVVSTALLAWLGQRLVGRAAIQTAVNQGFKEVMEQMRQELRAAIKSRDDAYAELADKDALIKELRATIATLEGRRPTITG